MPDFLSIVNMAGPSPCTMALLATNCSETSEKTRDHPFNNVEGVSLPIFDRLGRESRLPAQARKDLGRQKTDA